MSFHNSFFPKLAEQLEDYHKNKKYVSFIETHLFVIISNAPLAIFEHPALANNCFGFMDELPNVKFYYDGEANNEEEARLDLANIMSFNHMIFEDIQWEYSYAFNKDGFCGVYKGMSDWMGDKAHFALLVPWMPEGCKIVYTPPEKKWTRRYLHPTASVVCQKGTS